MPAAKVTRPTVVALTPGDDAIVSQALAILSRRLARAEIHVGSPDLVKPYLTLKLAAEEWEVFAVLWLDVKNRVLAYEELFFGTLTQTSVYPREVVKAGLQRNAASCIAVHNHPSGEPDPSAADRALTEALKQALALVDIRLLDHIIVGGMQTLSFAERGLL